MKDKSLVISDSYSLKSRIAADVENFMFQGKVYLPGEDAAGYLVKVGEAVVINGNVKMKLTYPSTLTPEVVTVNLDDIRFTNVWGKTLYRLSLTSKADAPVKGEYKFVITRL